jgi:hypothetical protein
VRNKNQELGRSELEVWEIGIRIYLAGIQIRILVLFWYFFGITKHFKFLIVLLGITKHLKFLLIVLLGNTSLIHGTSWWLLQWYKSKLLTAPPLLEQVASGEPIGFDSSNRH